MKCFYHSADLDGHCSGAIVFTAVGCEMIGYNYGKPFPWESIRVNEVVYMVDVSLPMGAMLELAQMCKKLVWIDHHISVIKDYEALCDAEKKILSDCVLDSSKAACELTWEHCYPETPVPPAVELLGIYDSWRFKTDEEERRVKEFQYGMRMFDETRPVEAAGLWHTLFMDGSRSDLYGQIQDRGQICFEYQLAQNEKTARACAFETLLTFGPRTVAALTAMRPLRCIAINSNLMNSDVFRSVYDPTRHDAMLCFYRSKHGFWRISIYSDQEKVDCSFYAKSHGGGGHKGAAGFQVEGNYLPFELGTPAK